MPSVEVRGLSKRYGAPPREVPALVDASFRYEGAGAVGLLGPNGAGKTTTLKLLVGLLTPTEGAALLNDVDLAESRKRALWDVGAVIENPEPYPTQTVAEALEMVGRFRGLDAGSIAEGIRALSEELRLPPMRGRCGALSKGQRQRVVLAGALLGDPGLLLLDEPETGLDPEERVVVRRLLLRLKKDHLILMSSHDMAEVSQIGDQLVFLNHGRVLLRDSVEHVITQVRSRQIDVEFAAPTALANLEALRPLVKEVAAITDRRFRVIFDGRDSTRAELVERFAALGPVLSVANSSLVLEEAYLELIGPGRTG